MMQSTLGSSLTSRVALLLPLLLLAGCSLKSESTAGHANDTGIANEEIRMSKMDVNKYPVTKTVCDPFGGTPDPRSNQGIKAELWWLGAGVTPQTSVSTMIANGTASTQNLFFSQLNVPTRIFEAGFATEAGGTVQNDTGSTLNEYFALRFKSVLRLSMEQAPGLYEFAILSDDGAVMNLRGSDGVYTANVNNDGDHQTRLACGIAPVEFTAASEIPMVLEYYQGPRYHISLILLMRKVTAGQTADPACGLAGNNVWFDADNGSKPQQAYTDLLARGWAPVGKDSFALANEVMFNPCKEGAPPVISNLVLLEKFNDGFVVTWNTDIPSTGQVVAKDSAGAQTITVSDNVLRTSHQVRITGLKSSTNYSVQAVSISDTYGRTISPAVQGRTDD